MVLSVDKEVRMIRDGVPSPRRERRSGMAYVFEGIPPALLERLGWTQQALEDVGKGFDMSYEYKSTSSEYHMERKIPTVDQEFPTIVNNETFIEDLEHDSNDNHNGCSSLLEFHKCSVARQRRNGLPDLFSCLSTNQRDTLLGIIAKLNKED